MQFKARDVALFIGGALAGDGSASINGINGVKEAGEKDLAFILDPKYESLIDASNAGCIIIPNSLTGSYKKTVIKVDNPGAAFTKIIHFAMPEGKDQAHFSPPEAVIAACQLVAIDHVDAGDRGREPRQEAEAQQQGEQSVNQPEHRWTEGGRDRRQPRLHPGGDPFSRHGPPAR